MARGVLDWVSDLTIPQALKYLKDNYDIKWSKYTLYTMIRRGRIEGAYKVSGKKMLIDLERLKNYAENKHGRRQRRVFSKKEGILIASEKLKCYAKNEHEERQPRFFDKFSKKEGI